MNALEPSVVVELAKKTLVCVDESTRRGVDLVLRADELGSSAGLALVSDFFGWDVCWDNLVVFLTLLSLRLGGGKSSSGDVGF